MSIERKRRWIRLRNKWLSMQYLAQLSGAFAVGWLLAELIK